MNKIDFAKIDKKEDMILAFNQLKDDYSIAFQQIQELTNNWNELEEWLKSNEEHFAEAIPFRETLRKMKEIKEGNNE